MTAIIYMRGRWKKLDFDGLNLEERMFVLGSQAKPLPKEPDPINREFYNLGLKLLEIMDYFSKEKSKDIVDNVNAFKESVGMAKNGKLEIDGDFPPTRDWVIKTYHAAIELETKEAQNNYDDFIEIQKKLRDKCKNLQMTLGILHMIVKATYTNIKEKLSEAEPVMQDYLNQSIRKTY